MNTVNLVGQLIDKRDYKETEKGVIIRATVETKNADKEGNVYTEQIPFVAFNNAAKALNVIEVGNWITVLGKIKMNKFESQGEMRITTEVHGFQFGAIL